MDGSVIGKPKPNLLVLTAGFGKRNFGEKWHRIFIVKALKEIQSTDPNLWPGFVLHSSANNRLLGFVAVVC